MENQMKLKKNMGGCGGGVEDGGGAMVSQHSHGGSFGRPSWLLFSIADMDERMRALAMMNPSSEEANGDTFGRRAEDYYHKRPQLLALLHDLYNGYLLLADRYCQALNKNSHRRRYSSPISPFNFSENDHFYGEDVADSVSDDAVSSLSFQAPVPPGALDPDLFVADLVIKSVDYELIANELSMVEMKANESSRKIELQKSLLEVLESERLILLNENASLAYRMNALVEENKGLATESVFMKRKAADLARCVLKMRDDHRVCLLSRKIEDLQAQIYGLEKRNKEYYDLLVKNEEEKKGQAKVVKGKGASEVALEDCFHVHQDFSCFGSGGNAVVNMKKGCLPTPTHGSSINGGVGGRRASKLWGKVKKFDIFFMCVPHVNSI